MDALELSTAVGSGVAAFVATWATMIKPLQREVEKPVNEVALLRQSVSDLKDHFEKIYERQERIEAQLKRTVTDEEFQSYSNSTTATVGGLTEKVGRIIGLVEAWMHRNRG